VLFPSPPEKVLPTQFTPLSKGAYFYV